MICDHCPRKAVNFYFYKLLEFKIKKTCIGYVCNIGVNQVINELHIRKISEEDYIRYSVLQ